MSEFNTPNHYKLSDGSDSMDALEKILGPDEFKGFLRGNALKYLIRYKQKGGIEDLKKAMDYVKRLAAVVGGEEDNPSEEEEKTIAEKLYDTCKKYKLYLSVDFDIFLGTEVSIEYCGDRLFRLSLDEEDSWYFVDRVLDKMPRPMAKELFEVCKDYARAPMEDRRELLNLF